MFKEFRFVKEALQTYRVLFTLISFVVIIREVGDLSAIKLHKILFYSLVLSYMEWTEQILNLQHPGYYFDL